MVCILILSILGFFHISCCCRCSHHPIFSLVVPLDPFPLCWMCFLFSFVLSLIFSPSSSHARAITITYFQPAFIKLQTSKTKGTRLVSSEHIMHGIVHSDLCVVVLWKAVQWHTGTCLLLSATYTAVHMRSTINIRTAQWCWTTRDTERGETRGRSHSCIKKVG